MRFTVFTLAIFVLCAGLTACKTQTYSSENGEIPQSLQPYVQPYLGTYDASHGRTLNIALDGDKLVLKTSFDLLNSKCGARADILRQVTVVPDKHRPDEPAAFDADFALVTDYCHDYGGRIVTFHYNRTLNGADVFLLDVVLEAGYMDSQGYHEPLKNEWTLKHSTIVVKTVDESPE